MSGQRQPKTIVVVGIVARHIDAGLVLIAAALRSVVMSELAADV